MAGKDIATRILFRHPDVFADAANALVFKRNIVKEEDLKHRNPELEDRDSSTGQLRQIERDSVMTWHPLQMAYILVFEHSSSVETYMAFRMIGYEGSEYLTEIGKDVHDGMGIPVISTVLNYSMTRWSGVRNLKSRLICPPGTEEEFEKYVNDFRMRVIDLAFLTEEERSRLTGDLRIVAEFLVRKREKIENLNRKETNLSEKEKMEYAFPAYLRNFPVRHPDHLVSLLYELEGDEECLKMEDWKKKEGKEVQVVSDLFEFFRNEGIAKGRAEGREEGKAEGREEGRVETTLHYVRHMMTTYGYSFEEALDHMGVSGELREKCKEQADLFRN